MGFRYHRSRQIIPGIRLNASKSGVSVSFGAKGARVNVGPKGIRTTVGLPGSGLSYVKQNKWGEGENDLTPQQWKTLWTKTLIRLAIYGAVLVALFIAWCVAYNLSGPHVDYLR